MRKIYFLALMLMFTGAYAQIEQNVNKTGGTESNPINEIDSIRFNGAQTEMEIILNNGNIESHTIEDVDNVTFSGEIMGEIDNLDCANATLNGTLVDGETASGVSVEIDYTGGNGGPHNGQTVNSTGVTGLTAELTPGNFDNGAGTLTYEITGTPDSDGTAAFEIEIGGEDCILELLVEISSVNSLDCANATLNGFLTDDVTVSNTTVEIDYTGGNGGPHNGQSVTSTGVTGLTAELTPGSFANGAGTLTYEITGTPSSDGTATFAIEIGGETCTLELTVEPLYPAGSIHCNGPADVVDVTNPVTGDTWMDRNLGAQQVATSIGDMDAYGDLYQWGRFSDGHQCRNSTETTTNSSSDQPTHGDFITNTFGASPNDWRIPQNDNLWQGANGINNPCPNGYRLPTETELSNERASWSSFDTAGAFDSPLKFPASGSRNAFGAGISGEGTGGSIWSSTIDGTDSRRLRFTGNNAPENASARTWGYSVRCIKD